MQNLNGDMLAPEGAENGLAEGGTPAPANAENQLLGAFGANADGGKPAVKPVEGDTPAGGKQTEGGVKLAAWADQLPPEMRGDPEAAAKLARFAKVGDMAKAFLELEGRPAVPGKDADPEEAAAFWEKAGKPKTAEGYAFAKDDGNDGGVFAKAAFEANLTGAQADALYRRLNAAGAERLQAAERGREAQLKETAAALSEEYGSKYQEKMELLARGLAAAGPNVGGLIRQAGLAGNPEIIKAFIAFGKMTAESGSSKGGGAGEPLKSVHDGGSFEFKL
jgi:hypothetical protein